MTERKIPTMEERLAELRMRRIHPQGLWINLHVLTHGWVLRDTERKGPQRCSMCEFQKPDVIHDMEHEAAEYIKQHVSGKDWPLETGCDCSAHLIECEGVDFPAALDRIQERERSVKVKRTRREKAWDKAEWGDVVSAEKQESKWYKQETARLKRERIEHEKLFAWYMEQARKQEEREAREEAERVAREQAAQEKYERDRAARAARLELCRKLRADMFLNAWYASDAGNHVLQMCDEFMDMQFVILKTKRGSWTWNKTDKETGCTYWRERYFTTPREVAKDLKAWMRAAGALERATLARPSREEVAG